MSHTYSARPSVCKAQNSQQKASNRQPTTKPPATKTPTTAAAGETSTNSPHRPDISERTQRRDAYTVIAPDEQKRRSLQQKAKEEERKMEEYRQQNRVQRVNYVGTVGDGAAADGHDAVGGGGLGGPSGPVGQGGAASLRGGPVSGDVSKMTAAQKTRYYRELERQRLDSEADTKKQDQRRKAAENEDREKQRLQKLDDDRRSKNEAFLNRLSNASKHSTVSRQAAAAVAMETASTSQGTNQTSSNNAPATSDPATPLDHLVTMFPNIPRETLQELLESSGGDLDSVIDTISDVDMA